MLPRTGWVEALSQGVGNPRYATDEVAWKFEWPQIVVKLGNDLRTHEWKTGGNS